MNESLCQRHNNGTRQWSHGVALSPALAPSRTAHVQNLRPWSEPLVSPPFSCHLTFSVADYWWDSLMRHMPRCEEWKVANTDGKIKIARGNIHDKAQIAAYHYATRFTVFMENALMPKSRVVDSFDLAAPFSLTISEIGDQPVVIKNPQRSAGHRMFFFKRNDPHLNRYNRTMSLRWLANTDITPRTSLQAVLNYLSEYCTKAGVKVPQYQDMLRATQGFKLTPTPISHRETD
ncbi:hypothetical protein D6D01_03910 [Aureobasidium pullulans]|uniref:Uncharacterized protein n=1 Tax=Aureobasidium pullulans TaxID=5580 RepID=A0A4S9LHE7_AURPU|nr:hypothetical protein D6D01_03910 [Aureobasidium pullulans]